MLGSVAAERLGITTLTQPTYVYVGEQYVEVVGILEEFPLSADLDRSAIMGQQAAETFYGTDPVPTTIFARVEDGAIDTTRDLIPATADAENPEEVTVSRPSDALEAQAAADDALTTLFLGLGAVALLVGGIGIANVMVIAVIERRGEIGLRRALGATRAHIRRQFLTEAVILSALGGAVWRSARHRSHVPLLGPARLAGHHPGHCGRWRIPRSTPHRRRRRSLPGDASRQARPNRGTAGMNHSTEQPAASDRHRQRCDDTAAATVRSV